MNLQFKGIRIRRFRSFLTETTLSLNGSGPGLYFLTGRNEEQPGLGANGAGKSSIVGALLWCLYGKTLEGLRNVDIIPWTGTGQTVVEVFLERDGEPHTVVRTAGPNLLQLDGVETGQQYVDDLIGIPFESISCVMAPRKPLFFDLTASKKLELLSASLGLDRWDDRSERAKKAMEALEKEITDLGYQLLITQKDIERDEALVLELKPKSEKWEQSRQEILKNGAQEKAKLQKRLEAVEEEHGKADATMERAEIEIRQSRADDIWCTYSVGVQKSARIVVQIKEAAKQKFRLEATLANVGDKVCPTCGQLLDKLGKDNIIKETNKQIKDIATELKKLNKELDAQEADNVELHKVWEYEEKAIKVFRQESCDARDAIMRLAKQIAEYKAEIRSIEQRALEYANQTNLLHEQIRGLRERIGLAKTKAEGQAQDLKAKQECCERLRFWIKGFKDIKLSTLEETLQELEITTNGMLEEFGLDGWQVVYDVEKESKSGKISKELNILIQSPHNKDRVKWEVWSGGEAQRLRIIGTAALVNVVLNHMGVSTNLEIYDEITDKLSKEGVADLVDLLAQRAQETEKSIWFVDQHVIESNKFIKQVVVVKDEKGSRVL